MPNSSEWRNIFNKLTSEEHTESVLKPLLTKAKKLHLLNAAMLIISSGIKKFPNINDVVDTSDEIALLISQDRAA